ncbi:MAG: hypothetical protein ABIP02_00660 [Arenimonas sp.]
MPALMILGLILAVVGGIWLLVVAFQTSILWGICTLLIPFVSLVFVVMHWQASKNPFLLQIAGGVLIGIAAAMAPGQIPVGT